MLHGKLPRLPLPDSAIDTVIASQVLEHVVRRDLFAAEIVRILAPGGQAFVFVPNNCLGPIDEPEHVIKYNTNTFEAFLRRHFDIKAIEIMKDANYTMSILFGHVTRRA